MKCTFNVVSLFIGNSMGPPSLNVLSLEVLSTCQCRRLKNHLIMNLPTINLVSLKPYQTNEPSFFDDTILSIQYQLKLAGFQTHVTCNVIAPDALNIVWGAHSHLSPPLEQIREIAKPEYTFIFNMEQIEYGNSFVTPEYISFLSEYRVLDYNQKNIENLKIYAPTIRALEFPVVPSLHMAADFAIPTRAQVPAADVAFWGAHNTRRAKTLARIAERGLRISNINNAFGSNLSRQIYNSNVCINVHALTTGIFEIARCLRPLAMGIPVVSELSHLPATVDWTHSGIVFCVYEEIPDRCEQLARDHELALNSIRKTQHFINRADWADIARAVILELQKLG